MRRSVLVTGGAGYIGSHTCKSLAEAGYHPVVLDNLSEGHRWAVQWGPLVVGDISDKALVSKVLRQFEVCAVLHFAAHAYVGESVAEPRKYYQNNVVNSLALLDAMVDGGVDKIVFSSSCATYGLPGTLPITEDHPQLPISPYGASKLFIEDVLRSYRRAYGVSSATLRYFNAAGADPGGVIGEAHDPETHVIPLIISAAQGRIPHFTVFGTDYETSDGTAVRDYVHVTDLADAHVRALNLLLAGDKSFALNLGTGAGHSIREVVKAVEEVGGRPVPLVTAPRRPGDPPALVAASTLASDLLGWKPRHSELSEIIETAWRWHRRMHQGEAAVMLREAG